MYEFLFISIILIILLVLFNNKKEPFTSINILDVEQSDKYLLVYAMTLQTLTTILKQFNLFYSIDFVTLLLAIQDQGFVKRDFPPDAINLIMFSQDENNLKALNKIFNEAGYNLSRFWGGYKFYPINGVDVKYYDRSLKNNETITGIEDQNFFDYRLPVVNVMFIEKKDGKIQYTNPYIRRTYPDRYYHLDDFLPLRKYKFNNFYVIGPRYPMEYIERVFGNKKIINEYNSSQLIYPRTNFKVLAPINKKYYVSYS